jgi:hypothetical protein
MVEQAREEIHEPAHDLLLWLGFATHYRYFTAVSAVV